MYVHVYIIVERLQEDLIANPAVDLPLSTLVNELWWFGVLQAILAILFGIVATFWPGLTLVILVYLLGAFVIGIGLTEVVHGLMSLKRRDTWWMTLFIGLVTLGAGVYLARHPDVSFATFILIVGIMFIARGVIDLVRAFIDRNTSATYKILNYIAGLAGIVAGVITLMQPIAGGVTFVWVLGLYGLFYGAISLVWSIEMRNELDAARTA